MLNKQIPGIRDRKHKSEDNSEIVRIIQDVGNFIEIQVRRGNVKRKDTTLAFVKQNFDYKTSNKKQWKS